MDDQGFQGSQGSQGSQDSNTAQQPDSHMPYPNEPRPHNPYRANVDPGTIEQRPRKWEDKKKLRKKNVQGIPQYDVFIVSARYDDERRTWMYTLNDWKNELIAGETPERMLV